MNFRFQNLLGAPYRGGNVVISEDATLLSPVGNRVSTTDLLKSQTLTLPFEASSNISRIAVSPDGVFLLAVDGAGRASFVNLRHRTVLHRITFKSPVTAVKFSPNGDLIAVGVGKLIQIWRSPGFKKEFFSFQLERTFADCAAAVTSLDWSPDSDYLLAGSKDLTVRLFSLKKLKGGNRPFLFLGHREAIVGAFFSTEKKSSKVVRVYSISRDGAIFTWNLDKSFDFEEPPSPGTPEQKPSVDGSEDFGRKRKSLDDVDGGEREIPLNKGKWELVKKDFFMQAPARLTACDHHNELDMVVVTFSNGVFGLYQMPDFVCIHLLSISREKITTAVFNRLGNWLTFGCAKLGQLLVWEWKSESYILKQQGHYFDVNCVSYSPDSQMLATAADDNKVKVWTVSSGFCFVTFSEHTNAVTAVHFMANNNCLLSASLDGTVQAWDLFRYRNFRTFTTPTPRQFVALASDQSGEIICAGTLDSFEIFVWSMKTGRLLDILSGHEGPVHGLMFSPTNAVLASSSWDKTVRLWDVFEGKGAVETFPHTHDVLTVVYRPDGKQLACSTLDGQIHFWDPVDGVAMYTIEGRRDIAGGRLMTDRRSAANSSSGKYFTTLCYSADGSYILAGGSSKYICMYAIADQRESPEEIRILWKASSISRYNQSKPWIQVAKAPDGNGGLYSALKSSKLLEDMAMRGVRYVDCYGVDNALVRVADPTFLGYFIDKGVSSAAKVVRKAYPQEKVGVFVQRGRGGPLTVVDYSEMDPSMASEINQTTGRLRYCWSNVCLHMFTLDFLNQVANGLEKDSIYHLAEKKIPAIHDYTMGLKLEQFIFDAFAYSPSTALFEVLREEEFAPVKNANGASYDTPDSARLMLLRLHSRWVVAAGGFLTHSVPLYLTGVEISPLCSYGGENLEAICRGRTFHAPSEITF